MGRLTNLKPRVAALNTQRVAPAITATERIRGRELQRIRDRILSRDCGICRCDECRATGRLLPATEVDHTIPLWAGGREADDNRLSLSPECHAKKSAQEAEMRTKGESPATR